MLALPWAVKVAVVVEEEPKAQHKEEVAMAEECMETPLQYSVVTAPNLTNSWKILRSIGW